MNNTRILSSQYSVGTYAKEDTILVNFAPRCEVCNFNGNSPFCFVLQLEQFRGSEFRTQTNRTMK